MKLAKPHLPALVVGLAVLIIILIILVGLFRPHLTMTDHLVVESGATTGSIVAVLKAEGNDISYFWLRLAQRLQGSNIKEGRYSLAEAESAWSLMRRLHVGDYGVLMVRVTLPEGLKNEQMADTLASAFEAVAASGEENNFSTTEFLALAADQEGYLFPDTYSFFPGMSAKEVIAQMTNNFALQTADLNLTYEDIILASILEREESDYEDRRLIADILLRRLQAGMRLQVDASLNYYLNKTSDELTLADLEADHPYNTYVNDGLPPTPIANPGLESLKAALDPKPNDYFYYLSAPDGTTYYAKTLEEHVANQAKYLND